MPKQQSNRENLYPNWVLLFVVGIYFSLGIRLSWFWYQANSAQEKTGECLIWNSHQSLVLKWTVGNGDTCRKFNGIDGKSLNLKTNIVVQVEIPGGQLKSINHETTIPLKNGMYIITVKKSLIQQNISGEVVLSIEDESLDLQGSHLPQAKPDLLQGQQNSDSANLQNQASTQVSPVKIVQHKQLEKIPDFAAKSPPFQLSYNIKESPPFIPDSYLQKIVDDVVNLVSQRGLSSENLSVSLVDLQDRPCCRYAGYQHEIPRFPASVAKLFWLVALLGQAEQENYSYREYISQQDLYKLIQDSDNNPASLIIDYLTKTTSGDKLYGQDYIRWYQKRSWINSYFNMAGYNVNLTQKNYPIPELNLLDPAGRELQMRENSNNPIRNSLLTYDVARLLYEIYRDESVSFDTSQVVKKLLLRDYELEKLKTYNSIQGFFGEGLNPSEISLYSKVGWTKSSRQDAAIISSRDGRVRYILVVFGDDPSFADNWEIFPDISGLVYHRMMELAN